MTTVEPSGEGAGAGRSKRAQCAGGGGGVTVWAAPSKSSLCGAVVYNHGTGQGQGRICSQSQHVWRVLEREEGSDQREWKKPSQAAPSQAPILMSDRQGGPFFMLVLTGTLAFCDLREREPHV